MARIQGTNQNDRLFGTRSDDSIEGLDGDDLILAGSGKNSIYGGAGNDRIVGGRDDDEIDGGSGDDHVWGRNGDDVLTYNLSENIGSTDYYDGGYHNDTLRLVLNREQYETPGILQDIAQFEQFLANNANPNTAGGPVFQFTAFNLTVRNIEQLELVIVDPPEVPTLSIDDPTVTEGDPGDNTSITFTVMRSGDNGAASTVNYSVTPGSATFPADYNDSLDPMTGSLNFAAGETSKTITLDITDDEIPEGTESFTVELSGATNASIVKGTGTGTILDDDLPSLSIDDPTVSEGDPGDVTSINFTVTRSGDNGAASTVNYSVTPGSAAFLADYNDSIDPLTGSLSFAANETSKTITLDITDDEIPEGTESFTVELSGASNASIVKGTGIGTILDDDLPSLSIDDVTVTEGDPGDSTTITFTVTRSGDNGAASTVNYSVTPGSATFPADYNDSIDPLTGSLSFAAGETSKTITLDITDDEIPEGIESFTVELSGATNANIVKGTGTGTILDDDLPSLSIDDVTVTEGDPGDSTTITFTMTRSGDNGAASTVNYSVMPGSATFPADYNDSLDPLTGSLSFAAGETSKTITLDVTDDEFPEGTESFTVELSGATNASIVKGTGTGTILDDDLPTLSIDDPTVTEGDPGDNTSITFTVMRSGDNGAASTVNYSVTPGSATFSADYNDSIDPLTGSLSFAAGETSKTITLDITDDEIPEGTESFTVELSGASNANIVKGTGTGTILDDDLLPGLSIDNPTVTEGDPAGPDATITFTVTRSGDSSVESTVDYTAIPGSALFPDDYNDSLDPLTGTLTFAAGEISKSITIDITDDLISEETETFTVVLSNPSNATIVQGTGTGTILDDEALRCGNTWGDPHYVTFDGLKYDYQGIGEYWLVQSTGTGGFDDLNIQTRTVAFRSGVSVNSAVAAEIGEDVLCINTWPTASTAGIEVRINGELVTDTSPITLDGGIFSFTGNQYQVEYTNGERLLVTDYGSHMTIRVCLLDDREGTDSIRGFLGDFDGDPSNDIALPNGNAFSTNISFTDLYGSYGESWRITQDESLFCYGPGETTETFTNRAFPRFAATLDIFPQDQIDAARALITATCDITDPALLDAAVLDYLISGDLSYIEAACTVEDPVDAAKIIDPKIIWQNDGQVIIGTAAAPANFNIGTNAAAPAGVVWTGFTVSDDWSQPGNWTPVGAPTPTDVVVFNGTDAGAVNIVDQNFEVAGLYYTAAGDYMTDLNGGSVLQVNGAATIDVVGPMNRVTLIVKDGTEVIAHSDQINVGLMSSGSGTVHGNLFVGGNAVVDASDVGNLSIGRETGSSSFTSTGANGSLTLGSNSTLTLGAVGAAATLNIGWSQNTNSNGSGSATGVFDALEKAALLDLNLSELNVGRGGGYGSGDGTLRWDQTEVITAPNVYFGRGRATGVLEVPENGEFYLGTETDPISNLRIAYSDAGRGTATANLDFTVTNPTFTAYIADDLSIGRETGSSSFTSTGANGSLTLGSNSTLTLGAVGAAATLNIGWSQNTNSNGSGSATGVFDALEKAALLDLNLSELNVGRGGGYGSGDGTLRWDQTEVITAPNVYFGRGRATGVLEVPENGEFYLGTETDPISNLRIAYSDAGRGTATANLDFTVTNPTFTAYIADDLSIGRETGSSSFTSTGANGSLTLGSNSTLTLGAVGAAATLNIGWSQNTNSNGSGSATGVFDALEKAALLDLNLSELNVGRGGGYGSGDGTLRWDQTEVITAPNVYFGRGRATGVLEVPENGEFYLGTETDPISNLRIAYSDAGRGTATANLDFTVTNPTFTAYIADDLSIGRETGSSSFTSTGANGSLTLGSNSTLTLGAVGAAATLNIGWSQNTNSNGSGSATGVFDALEKAALLDLNLSELNVGRGGGYGSGDGTLRWDQTEVITAPNVYFGRGRATGVLEVPENGEFYLGTETDPISNLRIAYSDAGRGTATANLDFTVTNPTFTAYIADDLSIGRETGSSSFTSTGANGSLTLGSNSTLTLGAVGAAATLNIGWSQNTNSNGSGSATGVFDALEKAALLDLNLSELNVGRGGGYGSGDGTLRWDQTEVITAPNVYFGRGRATGVLEVPENGEFYLGTETDPISNLRIAYSDAGRGTATANLDFTVTNPTFTAYIADDLSIGRETGSSSFTSTGANGSLTLGSNSTLTLGAVGAAATLNIGWSQNTNSNGSGSATGVFDALEKAALLDLNLSELNVGRGGGYGSGDGTLRWDQAEVITAPNVYFGRGRATGVLEVPENGEFYLGTETDPISNLRIAYSDAGRGTATANLDFTVTNPTFTAYIADDLSIGRETGSSSFTSTGANGSLTLGSNSTLTLGAVGAAATLNIGWSQNTNSNGSGSATGVFDALEKAALLDLNLSELNVGRGGGYGSGDGTLRWDQTEVITAPNVYFGRGRATGVLEVPENGEFYLGTETDPISNLRIAYSDAGRGTATANLDFTVTNPTFTAYIADDLSIGRETGSSSFTSTGANGSLTLGSNSTLTLGAVGAAATLNIGWSQNTNSNGSGSATGVFDTSLGNLIAELSTLRIGQTSNRGSADGHFIVGDGVQLNATTVNIGVGNGATGTLNFVDNFTGNFHAETINLNRGLFDFGNNTLTIDTTGNIQTTTFNLTGGTLQGGTIDYDDTTGNFNFTGGTLVVGTFNGTLIQTGGTMAPGNSPGITTVNGNYNLSSAGTVQIELNSNGSAGVDFDQLDVNGVVNLNADVGTGGELNILLGFTPSIGNSFTIIDNDASDLIIGFFEGLGQLANFDVVNGNDHVTFQIDYAGGDGNDVVLTATNVMTAVPLVATRLAVQSNDASLTGAAGDEPLVFGTGAASAGNLSMNPETPLELMIKGVMDAGAVAVDDSGAQVNLDEGAVLDFVPDLDDAPLIGLSSDMFDYHDSLV